jgi:putative ABC transport system permease protein
MGALRNFAARLRSVLQRSRADRDFEQELQSHVEMLTDDNIARGMTPEQARRAAALRVGSTSSLTIRHRDARGLPWIEDLIQDVTFAGRLIARDKWFSAAAIVAIALGIGANTLGFTIINAAFFRGFGFDQADRLYAISWEAGALRRTSAVADLEDWRAQASAFQAIAGSSFGAVNISDDVATPLQTQGVWVTANLFDVLRQAPLIGRTFLSSDALPSAPPVVIIGHDLWQTRFNGDAAALGRTLRINGTPATIVGVMPAGMKFPGDSELWMPFVPSAAQLSRAVRPLGVFGRLADGATRESAAAQMDAIARRIMADYPDETRNLSGVRLETLIERYLGSVVKAMFFTIMGAVIFVLLIACANVASLLLSRSVYRSREIAVRFSMGATRGRVIRQLLVESTTLSVIGGVAGLALASVGVRAFDAAIQATQPPYWLSFTIDYRVLAYVAAVCVATGVLFGMAPAWQLSKSNHLDTLKDGGRGAGGSRRSTRFGTVLVVGELTLTIVLLCGAGLMTRSFAVLYSADPGFDLSGLYRMRMQLPPEKYPAPGDRERFFDQIRPRLSAIPGVSATAITTAVPPLDVERVVEIDGQPLTTDSPRRFVGTVASTPDYFALLGVPLVRGRYLDEGDGAPGRESVVINQRMAEQFFAGEDPIGRRLRFAPEADSRAQPTESWRTVVGVTKDILQGSPQDGFRNAVVYSSLRQESPRTASIMVRTTLPPNAVMTEVRRAVQSIDGDQPVFAIQSAAAVFAEERSIYEIFATLFSVLALIAVTLSSVGIYGVMAYAVTQRTQEIGVRMAIGAGKWQVSWLFLKRGLMQLLTALALGVPMALALATVVRFRLVEIEPTDPPTMIAAIVIVAAVVAAACLVPVRKAARVDPVNALRAE